MRPVAFRFFFLKIVLCLAGKLWVEAFFVAFLDLYVLVFQYNKNGQKYNKDVGGYPYCVS